jgi:hypothetical protein
VKHLCIAAFYPRNRRDPAESMKAAAILLLYAARSESIHAVEALPSIPTITAIAGDAFAPFVAPV